MKFAILSFILFALFSCQDSSTNNDLNKGNVEQEQKEKFKNWNDQKIENASFKLPDSLKLQSSFSTPQKSIFTNENNSHILIVAVDSLKPENRNRDIYQLVGDIESFGKGIYEEEKQMDKDLELMSTEKSKIGNLNSILLTQKTFELSGLNRSIIIEKHFCTSQSLLFKISVVYPENSSVDQELKNKVLSSFSFN